MQADNKSGLDTGAISPAARMFMEQMRSERRSFWGVLFVFFLLLAAIGTFLLYEVLSVSEKVKAEDFRGVGMTAQRFTDMRNDLNTQQTALAAEQDANREARQAMSVALRASRESPSSLLPEALGYAEGQLLGVPLNTSTASLVFAAASAAKGEDADMLNAALADWRDQSVPAVWAKGDEALKALARSLLTSPTRKAFGHAVLASEAFRRSQARGSNSAWDSGCKDAVAEVEEAAKANVGGFFKEQPGDRGEVRAHGLNLMYWRAHCLRKHSDAKAAYEVFKQMIAHPALGHLNDTDTLKVQAYHGYGTTMIALANDPSTPGDQAREFRKQARAMLEKSGELRISGGVDESNKFGTTENIGFLILRDDAPDKLVQALNHTQHIDTATASTWNLVVQLAAATTLYGQEKLDSAYSKDQLRRIIFETYAKLAQQDPGTLNVQEVSTLIGSDFGKALQDADDCIQHHDTCYAQHAKAFAK